MRASFHAARHYGLLQSLRAMGSIKHDEKGAYQRRESQFRRWVTADGSSGFPAESGRYHLYVSYACPWAHRTLVVRSLKGLEKHVGVSAVHWLLESYPQGPGL